MDFSILGLRRGGVAWGRGGAFRRFGLRKRVVAGGGPLGPGRWLAVLGGRKLWPKQEKGKGESEPPRPLKRPAD
jgi:hypothetical protein